MGLNLKKIFGIKTNRQNTDKQALSDNEDKFEFYYDRAFGKEDEGDVAGAIEDYMLALSIRPDVDVYNSVGVLKDELEDIEGAIVAYSQGLAMEPDNFMLLNNRGITRFESGDYKGAIGDFDKAITLLADDGLEILPDIYHKRGKAKCLLEEYDESLEDFDTAIELNPHNEEYFIDRATVLNQLNRFDEAEEDLHRAIKTNPRSGHGRYIRGLFYTGGEQNEAAIHDLTIACKLDPELEKAKERLAKLLPDKDIDEYLDNRTIEFNIDNDEEDNEPESFPGETEFDFYAGRASDKMIEDDLEGAVEDYTKALEIHPDNECYNNLGVVKYDLEDYQGALEAYNKGLEIVPDDYVILYNRAQTKVYMGNYAGAIEDYTLVLELDPDHKEQHYFARGKAKAQTDDKKGAFSDFYKAVELSEHYEEKYYIYRATASRELGNIDSALEDLHLVIENNPESAEGYYVRGTMYAQMNETAQAIKDLTMALKIDAALEPAQVLLQQLNNK